VYPAGTKWLPLKFVPAGEIGQYKLPPFSISHCLSPVLTSFLHSLSSLSTFPPTKCVYLLHTSSLLPISFLSSSSVHSLCRCRRPTAPPPAPEAGAGGLDRHNRHRQPPRRCQRLRLDRPRLPRGREALGLATADPRGGSRKLRLSPAFEAVREALIVATAEPREGRSMTQAPSLPNSRRAGGLRPPPTSAYVKGVGSVGHRGSSRSFF
jgi:hypothetical protein